MVELVAEGGRVERTKVRVCWGGVGEVCVIEGCVTRWGFSTAAAPVSLRECCSCSGVQTLEFPGTGGCENSLPVPQTGPPQLKPQIAPNSSHGLMLGHE